MTFCTANHKKQWSKTVLQTTKMQGSSRCVKGTSNAVLVWEILWTKFFLFPARPAHSWTTTQLNWKHWSSENFHNHRMFAFTTKQIKLHLHFIYLLTSSATVGLREWLFTLSSILIEEHHQLVHQSVSKHPLSCLLGCCKWFAFFLTLHFFLFFFLSSSLEGWQTINAH